MGLEITNRDAPNTTGHVFRQIGLALLGIGAMLAGSVLGFFAVLVLTMATHLTPPFLPRSYNALYALIGTVAPLVGALVTWHLLKRHHWFAVLPGNLPPAKFRVILLIIGMLYGLTAILGVPAVLTHNSNRVADVYTKSRASYPRNSEFKWTFQPYIVTYAATPVAPGLILIYHEYPLAIRGRSGGFGLFLWYGESVVEVYHSPLWYSDAITF